MIHYEHKILQEKKDFDDNITSLREEGYTDRADGILNSEHYKKLVWKIENLHIIVRIVKYGIISLLGLCGIGGYFFL